MIGAPASDLRRVLRELVDLSRQAGNLRIDAAASNALTEELLDAFAKGEVERAFSRLLDLTPNRQARRDVLQLIDSALLSLGVDLEDAKASWHQLLSALAASPAPPLWGGDLRRSPVRDAFRGITMRLDDAALEMLRRQSHRHARLEASLTKALTSEPRLEALRSLEGQLDLARTPDGILMGIVGGYREIEAWSDLLRFLEAVPSSFRNLPATRREHALALFMAGQVRPARSLLRLAVAEGDRTPATLGLLGRVLKDRYDSLALAHSRRASRYLHAALDAYRQGLDAGLTELYPGVALPVLLETAGDPASLDEAKLVARLLLFSTELRWSFGEQPYWEAATGLEATLSLRDFEAAKLWLDRALAAESEPWMRRTTVINLRRLRQLRAGRGEGTVEIDRTIERLAAVGGAVKRESRAAASVATSPAAEPTLHALLAQSYRFGGRSPKWLSGNYSYQGIAHDVRVTPADMVYFRRVLAAAGLDRVDDPEEASRRMDALIRAHFGTDAMEDRESEAHRRYDRVMPALAQAMAARRENSQTNVSADWINRLADCRQHAPAKLMLWEAWKRLKTEELLQALRSAWVAENVPRASAIQERLRALNSWELRILDGEIVDAESGALLELHTMTLLARRGLPSADGEMRSLAELHLADSFYHHRYPLAEGRVVPELRDGKLWIAVPGRDHQGRRIALVPAPYSFDRAAGSVDSGELTFRGVQVASPGWERDVSVSGVDLRYLHDFADKLAKK